MTKFGFLILAVVALVAAAVALDVNQDRRYKVHIDAEAEVHSSWELDSPVLFSAPAEATYSVKRIRYGKDHMALRVEIPAHGSGWVYADQGAQVVWPER
jgi:hypothetical protein